MSNLQRKNNSNQQYQRQSSSNNSNEASKGGTNKGSSSEDAIAVNGFGQVIAMLRAADDVFKASLISRIALRDPKLARKILDELKR